MFQPWGPCFTTSATAARQLVKNPGLSLTAIISLAFGIGATTAVFSVVYAILMNPYPYAASRPHGPHAPLGSVRSRRLGLDLTGAQWQELRKSPVVEDAFTCERLEPHRHRARFSRRLQRRLHVVECLQFHGSACHARPWPAALGRRRRPGSAACRRPGIQILAAATSARDPGVARARPFSSSARTTPSSASAARVSPGKTATSISPRRSPPIRPRTYYVGIRLKPGVLASHSQCSAGADHPAVRQGIAPALPHRQIPLHRGRPQRNFVHDLGGTLVLLLAAVAFCWPSAVETYRFCCSRAARRGQHEFAVRTAIGASRRSHHPPNADRISAALRSPVPPSASCSPTGYRHHRRDAAAVIRFRMRPLSASTSRS